MLSEICQIVNLYKWQNITLTLQWKSKSKIYFTIWRDIKLSENVEVCCDIDHNMLWLWHSLYSVGPHPVSSLHIYTFVVSRAFMAGVASQAGDADSSRAPDLTSGLQGSMNVHRGALLLVPQWHCISSFVFYMCLFCFCNSVALPLFSHRSYKSHGAIENMVDVFGALWTDTAQEILAEKILRSPKPNPALVQRVLIHVVSSDRSPSQVCVGLTLA